MRLDFVLGRVFNLVVVFRVLGYVLGVLDGGER